MKNKEEIKLTIQTVVDKQVKKVMKKTIPRKIREIVDFIVKNKEEEIKRKLDLEHPRFGFSDGEIKEVRKLENLIDAVVNCDTNLIDTKLFPDFKDSQELFKNTQ